MKNITKFTALGLSLILLVTGCGAVVTEGYDPAAVSGNKAETETTDSASSETADPKDDFYKYVNGETLANAQFEYGEMSFSGGFDSKLVEEQVKDVIRDVVSKDGYEKGTEEYIIKTAYEKFSAYDFESKDVPAELDALLHEIDAVNSVEELLAVDAKMQRDFGVTNIFNLNVDCDYLSAGDRILTFNSYSGVHDASFKDLEESYSGLNSVKDAGSAVLRALGHSKEEADEVGTALGILIMDLYNVTDMDIVNSLMPFKYIKTYTADEIDNIFVNVDLRAYLAQVGFDPADCGKFAVYDAGQLKGINDMLTEENLNALKTWKMMDLAGSYRRFLAAGYEEFEKYRTIDYTPEEDRVLDEIMSVYEETDPLYVERYYTKEMDDALVSMCDDIREGYRQLISGADWLSDASRAGLLKKLDNIIYVTGADRKRHDAEKYKDLDGKDYYEYYRNYSRMGMQKKIESLSEPVDRKEIAMPMQMVNACYDPTKNNITITVAITNAPFFDVNADYYTNLGGLGSVIAHEMGHAFDSNCILFDADGNYNPSWIDSADLENLNSRNEKAVRYFEDKFTIFGVYHVDGEQTLGENYADLGGMECITSLAKTQEQRKLLFENYAKIWCEKNVDTVILDQIDSDEHSPAIIRVNAMLSTIDVFYETYGVAEGDGMYIAPEDRISRWH